jgi:hypothetical protein
MWLRISRTGLEKPAPGGRCCVEIALLGFVLEPRGERARAPGHRGHDAEQLVRGLAQRWRVTVRAAGEGALHLLRELSTQNRA